MSSKSVSIKSVEALKPGQQIWDCGQGAVKGFGARRQRAHPTYVLKYRFKGRQRFFTIGPHGSPWTPVTARNQAKRLLGLIACGIDPAYQREATKQQPTLAEFADRYIAEFALSRKKPRSVEEDRRNLRLHILPSLGTKRLPDVTRADIARFCSSRSACPVNANRCLALLSHIFAIACRWGVLPDDAKNPARGVEKFPEKRLERMMSPAELARLGKALVLADQGALASVDGSRRKTPEDWRAIACYRLLLFTGARLNEILSLQWDWIDWQRGIARLPDFKTGAKNLHLSSPAICLLKRLPRHEGSPFVLPGNSASHFCGVQKPWQRIRLAAGLPDLRIHDLRHAFASLAVANQEAIFLVGAVLGHRNVGTTQRYAHLADGPVKAVADRTSQRMASMLSGEAPDAAPLAPDLQEA